MKKLILLVAYLLLFINACASPTPEPTAIPTDIPPTPTNTPLPTIAPTITPTATPTPIDLSGDWYLKNKKDNLIFKSTITQAGDDFSGLVYLGVVNIKFNGKIDQTKKEMTGNYSSPALGSGPFRVQLVEKEGHLTGSITLGYTFCMARDKALLPMLCD